MVCCGGGSAVNLTRMAINAQGATHSQPLNIWRGSGTAEVFTHTRPLLIYNKILSLFYNYFFCYIMSNLKSIKMMILF